MMKILAEMADPLVPSDTSLKGMMSLEPLTDVTEASFDLRSLKDAR
jgi:hypothetical protein